ncbi:glucans biosynthesis glucosyltransferase H [mine drainage metagenome]|uniref:Glucans biosynthesis glucosyltransferase H n=1 Tax=mine drainage metagenome TaxID=410659 RepID=A0A1J5RNG3_9ZZZZ
MILSRFDPAGLDRREVSRRRHRLILLVVLIAGPAVLLMADLHWRTGYDVWRVLHLAVFSVLSVLIALGAAQALIGCFQLSRGGDPCRITDALSPDEEARPVKARTAVVMPICNEDVDRVVEGMRITYESLARTGRLDNADFFLLSDSTDPNRWVEEEAAWLALVQRLGAQKRIFYRKRRIAINRKSGNIADFCRRWGGNYDTMVVMDADSIMTGEAIVRLVQLMEHNPGVGIIQGVPRLANSETVLARMQQFAGRLYGSVFAAGLNYWQLGEANYWGHNAIIRLEPFIRHCSLPELPGEGPFGGRIMSHDFVEAALMRRAGWEVWLAAEMDGNYEECPGDIVEFAQRDRRWLQGNLQHARLVVARGFHPANRVHFALGILSYLASPLWLVFLVLSVVIAARFDATAAHPRMAHGLAGLAHLSYATQAQCLFWYTIGVLLLPKFAALVALWRKPDFRSAFGDRADVIGGVVLETVLSTLLAPVLMLYHSLFFAMTLLGRSISWRTQRRALGGEPSLSAIAGALGAHTLAGFGGFLVVHAVSPELAFWMAPVFAGLILAIPLAWLTGSPSAGRALRAEGLFKTPEESRPVPELVELTACFASRRNRKPTPPELAAHYGLLQAVLDPYVNAVHVSLLRAKDKLPAATEARLQGLRETLLREGPAALAPDDRLSLMMDVDSMIALHDVLWSTPAARLAEWWRQALKHYEAIAASPVTAFSKKESIAD